MIVVFVAAAITGLAVSATVVWSVARYGAHVGLLDVPNQRSSHLASTPRGGGVGVLAGVAAGVLVFAAAGMPPTQPLRMLLLGVAMVAALGAMDDVRSIPAQLRLIVQLAVAIVVVAVVGAVPRLPLPPPLDLPLHWLASPLTVLWLVGVTNFYNFMDGIDGLAGGQAIASSIGIAIAGWSLQASQFATVLAVATAGFLLFNRHPARVFLGDVGSTSLGFGIAAMPLLAPAGDRPMAVLAVAIGLSLFLLDPLETLLRLMRAGHKLGVAHRMHSYQRLAATGGPRLVAAVIVACGLALSVGGALAYRSAGAAWATWPLIAAALGAYAVERFAAGRTRFASDMAIHD
jgi:UDP-N-acetylmuramyl pentapeptide phosphotransferase/UDP-N-acetylglucosamine-1-phosphate transferase